MEARLLKVDRYNDSRSRNSTSALFNILTRNSRLRQKITKAKLGVKAVDDCESLRDRVKITM